MNEERENSRALDKKATERRNKAELAYAKVKKRVRRERIVEVTSTLRSLRERAGLTMAEMADLLGYKGPSSYQRYEDPGLYKKSYLPPLFVFRLLAHLPGRGSPAITEAEVENLFGEVKPGIKLGKSYRIPDVNSTIRIVGEVQAGMWREIETLKPEIIAHTPIFAGPDQFGLVVRGDSMNRVAQDGDFLVCLSVPHSGLTPQVGDLVVVERTRDDGSIVELSVKRLSAEFDGTQILVPESHDPAFQEPLNLNETSSQDVEVRIIAVVLAVLSIESERLKQEFLPPTPSGYAES